ncbi:DEAD-box ATP-dependent RNA helicase 21 [Abeliophyllum distichum]|uniref:DEAD-box ATP-dependent RNA helicase 21 n=1 Tax=Abeliophyllum distichum TaxID=126358 RepID=A0ABD1SH82_9LAMI
MKLGYYLVVDFGQEWIGGSRKSLLLRMRRRFVRRLGRRRVLWRREEAAAQTKKEKAANLYDTFDMRVDRHWSEKKLEEMTERDWRIFREDFNISYKGSKILRSMRSWMESKLSPELLRAVERAGYKTPSPIQMAAIPLDL